MQRPTSLTASETVTRHGREPRRLLMRPLPSRERAPPQFNTTDWVRGSLEPLTRPHLLNIQHCPLPQGESDCLGCQAVCHGRLSLMMALRIVSSFRATAMSATIFGLPEATRRL